jgi:hypothetical protein
MISWDDKTDNTLLAFGDDPVAIYAVRENALRRGHTRYIADVLTEVGRHNFDHKFHTEKGAKRFCERHFRSWQKKQPAPADSRN